MPKKTQNEVPDTVVVGDTSALISLGVGGVISKCLKISRIIVPEKVQSELGEMSKFNDDHGKAAQETIHLISNGDIEVGKVKQIKKIEKIITGYTSIDEGEAEALILDQENSIPILITDDFRSLSDLKKVSMNVEIHLSTYLLARLVIENLITNKEAQIALDRISEGRTWESAAIYRFAMRYIEELSES